MARFARYNRGGGPGAKPISARSRLLLSADRPEIVPVPKRRGPTRRAV